MQFVVAAPNGDSGTPFGSLLLAVFNSIIEVVLICSAGYALASHGILDKKTQKQMNKLNVSLFTPALLFSKVALYLTPEKLTELWVIPIWFVSVTAVSMTVGSVLGWMFQLRASQRSFVMAAAMFMNSNALPIALMQSLVVAVPDLAWGPGDEKNAMLGRALTYLTMYSTLGMVVRYSYGIRLLARADTVMVSTRGASGEVITERTPLLVDIESADSSRGLSTRPSTSTMVSHRGSNGDDDVLVSSPKSYGADSQQQQLISDAVAVAVQSGRPVAPRRCTTFYRSFPNSPNDSCANLGCYTDDSSSSSSCSSGSESDDDTDDVPPLSLDPAVSRGRRRRRAHRHSFRHRFVRGVKYYWTALNDFMTVPLWAALLSLFVACIPPLQYALTHDLHPINNAINTAGKCSVPITLVVLGAYFYAEPKPASDEDNEHVEKRSVWQRVKGVFTWKNAAIISRRDTEDGGRVVGLNNNNKDAVTKPGETRTVVLAVLARMVVTPIMMLPLVILATKYDWHRVFADPVFVVCNIILLASPPALTLAQITQTVSGDAFERLISRTIFWSYCVCTPPVTIIYVVLGLFLSRI